MRKAFFILFLISICLTAIGQDNKFIFLSKKDIYQLKIREIKTKNCSNYFSSNLRAFNFPDPDEHYFCNFQFKNGVLVELIDKHERIEYRYYDSTFARNWSYIRRNRKPKEVIRTNAILKRSLDNQYGPFIKEWEVMQKNGFTSSYNYGNKLYMIKTYVNDGEEYATDAEIKFSYNNSGHLVSAINRYDLNETLFQIFIYKNNNIAGYYPARQTIVSPLAINADSIYNETKIRQISKMISPVSHVQNFSKGIINKIIEDSYNPVNATQVMIDGLDLKQFLRKINKSDAQYIVIEVADNYFLFYKLI